MSENGIDLVFQVWIPISIIVFLIFLLGFIIARLIWGNYGSKLSKEFNYNLNLLNKWKNLCVSQQTLFKELRDRWKENVNAFSRKISEQKSIINTQDDKIDYLNKKINNFSKLEEENKGLLDEIRSYKANIEELRSDNVGKVSKLEEENKGLLDEIRSYKANIEVLKKENYSIINKIIYYKNRINKLKINNNQKDFLLKEKFKDILKLKSNILKFEKDRNLVSNNLNNTTFELNKLRELILEKDKLITSLKIEANYFSDEITKKDDNISSLIFDINEIKKTLINRENHILNLNFKANSDKKSYDAKISVLEDEIKSNKYYLGIKLNRISDLQQAIASKYNKNKELESILESYKEENLIYKEKLENVNSQLNERISDFESSEYQILKFKNERQDAVEKKLKLEADFKIISDQNLEYNNKVHQLIGDIESLSRKNKLNEQRIESLTNTQKENRINLNSLKEKLSSANYDNIQLKSRLDKVYSDFDKEKNQNILNKDEFNKITLKLNLFKDQNETLKSHNDSFLNKINDLEKDYSDIYKLNSTLKENYDDLKLKYESKSNLINFNKKTIKDLNFSINKLKSNNENLKTLNDKLIKDYEQLELENKYQLETIELKEKDIISNNNFKLKNDSIIKSLEDELQAVNKDFKSTEKLLIKYREKYKNGLKYLKFKINESKKELDDKNEKIKLLENKIIKYNKNLESQYLYDYKLNSNKFKLSNNINNRNYDAINPLNRINKLKHKDNSNLILFDEQSSVVSNESLSKIRNVIKTIKESGKDKYVYLKRFLSDEGDLKRAECLSADRADAIRELLFKGGVPLRNIEILFMGRNDNYDIRAVEIEVLDSQAINKTSKSLV